MEGKSRFILLLMLLIVLTGLGRTALFVSTYTARPGRIFSPDSASYLHSAKAILHTGRFAVSPERPDMPQIIRTPGYPLFLAGMFWLFGEHYAAVIALQILFSLGTIIIVYVLAEKLWGAAVGLIAAMLLACDLPSFLSSQKILTETIFAFVLNLTVLVGMYAIQQPHPARLSLYGFLLSGMVLIRPIAYYLIFPLALLFLVLWRSRQHWPRRKILLFLVSLCLPWIICIGGWHLRNYLLTGSAEFSAIQGVNLLFYRGAGIVAQRDGITFEEARQYLGYEQYSTLHPETQGWSEAQLSQRWKQEGIALILHHPWLCAASQIRGAIVMLLGPGKETFREYIGSNTPVTDMVIWLEQGFLIVFYLALLFSVGLLLYRNISSFTRRFSMAGFSSEFPGAEVHAIIWVYILYFIILAAGPEAYSRFRVPIMPLLALYAGHGLSQFISLIRMNTKPEWLT